MESRVVAMIEQKMANMTFTPSSMNPYNSCFMASTMDGIPTTSALEWIIQWSKGIMSTGIGTGITLIQTLIILFGGTNPIFLWVVKGSNIQNNLRIS